MITSRAMLRVNRNIRENFLPLETHECSCRSTVYTVMKDYHENTDFHKKRMYELSFRKNVEAAYDELFALATPFDENSESAVDIFSNSYDAANAALQDSLRFDMQYHHPEISISLCDFDF